MQQAQNVPLPQWPVMRVRHGGFRLVLPQQVAAPVRRRLGGEPQ
jgi:hypothetical protein